MTAAPVEPVPPAPTREKGYTTETSTSSWWVSTSREKTPELRWPYCLDVYENMPTQDAQVSSVMRAVTTPILRTPWRLDGTGCRPEVVAHVAADLGLPVVGEGNDVPAVRSRGRFSWGEHLAIALEDSLQFGHAIFEQTYWFDGELWHLKRLGYRPPHTISKFNVARDGGLVSIEQKGVLGSATEELEVERLVAYVHGKKGGNWIGRSLLRPAYKFWILKDRALRVQSQTIERQGMGIPVYTAASGETSLAAGQEIASGARAGDNSGVALPNGADLELLGVTGDLPDADAAIRYYDEQIARAVLAHFLNLGTQTGSWALGSTFADFFTLSLQSVAEEIRETATQHIVEDLVDLNWGPEEPAPRIVFDEIGSRRDAIVHAISVMVGAGVLKPDEDLEQFVRTALGLPPQGAATEVDPVTGKPRIIPKPDALTPESEAAIARNVVEMVQKVYLGVGKVLSEDEARELLNRAGAGLTAPWSQPTPSNQEA